MGGNTAEEQSPELCTRLFDLVPCYISVQDRQFRIIAANRRVRETFGEPLGHRCYELYKKLPGRCPSCPVAATFEDGQSHTSEEVLLDAARSQTHVVVHTAAIRDAQDNVSAVMEVLDDITEVRALQDKLASIGRLVGGIAHGIKNILEGLRGGVYIVNLGFRDNNPDDIRTGWEMVERNVGRISAMVMDMLYCARDRSPRRLPVSLAAAAHEVATLFESRANDAGVRLRTEVLDGAITITGEPKDLHALFSNLVTNAIDACLSDPSEDKSHEVLIRVSRQGKDAVIEVSDNGAGMDEDTRSKLFTMSFSTKGTFGTGLGLLVSHKVVAEHGGTVSVSSGLGQGSTFSVRLPLEVNV